MLIQNQGGHFDVGRKLGERSFEELLFLMSERKIT